MKYIGTAIVVIGLLLGVRLVYNYWETSQPATTTTNAVQAAVAQIDGNSLPGLPAKLQPMLDAAQQRGAAGLGEFLKSYEKSISVPRLAWIQLDYVVLEVKSDPVEARRIFAKVKDRITADSPVYPRVQQLAPTYQ